MARPVLISLLFIFIIHLAAFTRLALKQKKSYQRMAAATFALLAAGYALRIWWPDWQLGGNSLHTGFRHAAWISSGATLLLFLRRKIQKR